MPLAPRRGNYQNGGGHPVRHERPVLAYWPTDRLGRRRTLKRTPAPPGEHALLSLTPARPWLSGLSCAASRGRRRPRGRNRRVFGGGRRSALAFHDRRAPEPPASFSIVPPVAADVPPSPLALSSRAGSTLRRTNPSDVCFRLRGQARLCSQSARLGESGSPLPHPGGARVVLLRSEIERSDRVLFARVRLPLCAWCWGE